MKVHCEPNWITVIVPYSELQWGELDSLRISLAGEESNMVCLF